MSSIEEQLANASREDLLEHIAIQREVIHRLNRKVMDLEATIDYLSSEPARPDDPMAAPSSVTAQQELMTPHHFNAPSARGVVKERTAAELVNRSVNVSVASTCATEDDGTAIEKIDAVLAAHRSKNPSLPADIVAELLYIREQLALPLPQQHNVGTALAQRRERRAAQSLPPRGMTTEHHETPLINNPPPPPPPRPAPSSALWSHGSSLPPSHAGQRRNSGASKHSACSMPEYRFPAGRDSARAAAEQRQRSLTPMRNSTGGNPLDIKWVSPKSTRIVYGPEVWHSDSCPAARRSASRRFSADSARDSFVRGDKGRSASLVASYGSLSPIPRSDEPWTQTPMSHKKWPPSADPRRWSTNHA